MSKVKTSAKSSTPKTTTKAKELTVTQVSTKNSRANTPIYLKEGVTGKMMMQSIYKANNASKAEVKSISWCIKQALKVGKSEGTFANIKNFKKADVTPKNILEFRQAHRIGKETFSVYEVLMMIKKMYQEA